MTDDRPRIEFTPRKTKLLQIAYDRAVAEQKDTFEFQGNMFVTDYAKYLLQYLHESENVK